MSSDLDDGCTPCGLKGYEKNIRRVEDIVYAKKKPIFIGYFWSYFPKWLQFSISFLVSSFCKTSLSNIPWRIYLYVNAKMYEHPELSFEHFDFQGKSVYQCKMSEVFTRRYKILPVMESEHIYPCNGLLSLQQKASETTVVIKGQEINIKHVFGKYHSEIREDYHYTQIFLHNCEYHHVHAIQKGKITGIETIPGKIYYLRPWFYPDNLCYSTLMNERVVVKIEDSETGDVCYLVFVAGPGANNIILEETTQVGNTVKTGDILGHFAFGSTVVFCGNRAPSNSTVSEGQRVTVGKEY